MRWKPYLPLAILLGLIALYAQLTSFTARSSPTAPSTPTAEIATTPDPPGLTLVLPDEVEVLEQDSQQALLHIDMTGHQGLLVKAYFSAPAKGWSLNLGDSISNNGWGGDARTDFHDAEVQILEGAFSIYASDAVGDAPPFDGGKRFLKTWPKVATAGQTVTFEVADGQVRLLGSEGESETFRHDALFALKGQPDQDGNANFDLYLGVNRTVSRGRSGSGIGKLELSFR